MQLLDPLIRFAAVGVLLNLAALVLLTKSRSLVLLIGSAHLISMSAVLINSSSFVISDQFRFVLKVFETPNVGLLWWFGLALFQDDFRLRPMHWFGMALACAIGFSIRMRYFGWNSPLPDLQLGYALSFLLMGHLLWSVLSEARGDLLNRRRSARFFAVSLFAVVSIGMGIAEITLAHEVQSFIRAVILLLFGVLATGFVTTIRLQRLTFVDHVGTPAPENPTAKKFPDNQLARDLEHAMNIERLYLRQGLTVAGLAEHVGVPEHQLRAHINRQTGFRNFSTYINHHRVGAAKVALTVQDRSKDGILGVALDSGFASLPTFNRVFKSVEGITPSEFRRIHLADAASD